MTSKTTTSKKKIKNMSFARVYVTVTPNNTLINFTDVQGNTFASSSAGRYFKNSKKSTPYAAQVACQNLITVVKEYGVKTIEIVVNGIGAQRDSVLRYLLESFNVRFIIEKTPVPHNGCRRKKRRRV